MQSRGTGGGCRPGSGESIIPLQSGPSVPWLSAQIALTPKATRQPPANGMSTGILPGLVPWLQSYHIWALELGEILDWFWDWKKKSVIVDRDVLDIKNYISLPLFTLP